MKVVVELAHVRCGNIAAEPAAADGPSGEKQHVGLEGGGVAAVRSVLAPLGEPVAVLGGDLAEQLDAVPSFVPVLARVVEVGGRWPPVALRGRVCERHEFQLGALRERRAGTAGVQFVSGGQAVSGRFEAPRGAFRPCSGQRLPENQTHDQDKHCDVEEELHHGTRSWRVSEFKGSLPNRDVASSANRDAGRTERLDQAPGDREPQVAASTPARCRPPDAVLIWNEASAMACTPAPSIS
jgi:hypothetical protein